VYPVQSFVRHSSESSNDVVLASQEEDEGKLRERDIAGSVANVLEVEKLAQVEIEEAQDSNQYEMPEDDYESANRRRGEREAAEP
jgi:hypothetical protein